MEQSAFDLLVPFDTDSPEFVRGVEVGMLVCRLQAERDPVRAVVHATNAEMMLRLGEALARPVSSRDVDADWIEVSFLSSPWPESDAS